MFVKPSVALNAHRAEIRKIVEENRATNARVFGSVLHGEDTEESDLDLLVEPKPGMTLLNLGAIRYKLADLLGVHVDVLTPNALPDKFKAMVIAEAQPV
nr:nucleotidyltransferase family protein [Trinickia dabaoshanensis]